MIELENRFFPEGQSYNGPEDDPATEADCNVWDWDQLRLIKIRGPAHLFPGDKDLEYLTLAKVADHLSPSVTSVNVNSDGLIKALSTDPEEDETLFLVYLPFQICTALAKCRTIKYSQLTELDRLSGKINLASYIDAGVSHNVVFKFNVWYRWIRLQKVWDEPHLLSSIPSHPNILPLDAIVLDDAPAAVHPRFLGFTTRYIPGDTLENPRIPFRLAWLHQLLDVVDYLNLQIGILHQDIAPRNLLIDPDT
ncbi:hypothetical protein BDW74DRAFT_172313 [Aspergillus multicolor]|uniref:uncharacterized protein n=1 Tax=Aspergillus multicolor TaxID=41759 RepID=UPI003CCCE450